MAQVSGVTQAMTNLNVAHRKLGLHPSDDPEFFGEWLQGLPELTAVERTMLDRLRQRYFYYAADGAITEGTIDVVLISPLLELLGLCDSPYKIRGEKLVKIEIESEAEILEGFIDALVVQEQFWLILIEEKRYGFSVMQALPQTLAYMMGQSLTETPGFGLITTGEDYLFVKVDRQLHTYGWSNKFTLSNPQRNELYDVVQVMKRLIGSVNIVQEAS
ncbi:MAG: type I restriction endonuclease subunit R [Lyngbya sp. HA4199-MV5]|jgi:hypothetical protein|nr:type I restriction endonuclease subunit R [Lyngbya sp. HA4199-MV5]